MSLGPAWFTVLALATVALVAPSAAALPACVDEAVAHACAVAKPSPQSSAVVVTAGSAGVAAFAGVATAPGGDQPMQVSGATHVVAPEAATVAVKLTPDAVSTRSCAERAPWLCVAMTQYKEP